MRNVDIRLTVDIVVQRENEVLLIRRKNEPYRDQWALPGGFIEQDEKIVEAGVRELREETGITIPSKNLHFIHYFDTPDRDPRGRVISFAFGVTLIGDDTAEADDDAAEVRWFSLHDLPELAFDHTQIINSYLNKS